MSPIPFMEQFIPLCVRSLSSIRLSPCLENVLCLRHLVVWFSCLCLCFGFIGESF